MEFLTSGVTSSALIRLFSHWQVSFSWLLFLLRAWHFWPLATALQTSSAPLQRFHTLTQPDWLSVPYLVNAPSWKEINKPQGSTSKQTVCPYSARPLTSTGAGIFVTTVVAGSVALVKPFTVASRPFLRDVIFYMVAVFWTFFILYRKTTTLGETFGTHTHTMHTQLVSCLANCFIVNSANADCDSRPTFFSQNNLNC